MSQNFGIEEWKNEYRILEEKYQNRESRTNDILRIDELEGVIKGQED